MTRRTLVLFTCVLGVIGPGPVQGQVTVRAAAQAIAAYSRVDPVPRDSALSEIKVEQDLFMVTADALGGHLRASGTLNLEGATMPDGVLTLGAWGEGFIERRHPHTYAHEIMLVALLGSAHRPRASLAVGKGFVPFGTDDPMNRPALRFPVNHHWSQILERALLSGALRGGPLTLEGTLFNGDEPEHPDQWPRLSRFGDSWAVRLGATPAAGLELQASRAHVKSPEHRLGAGTDQEKWSVSARVERATAAGVLYGLGEWARTEEIQSSYRSWLLEASWTRGHHRAYYRFEDTARPEEERLLDPFRSVRPHFENSIVGATQWRIHTAGYGSHFTLWAVLEPILEMAFASVSNRGGGLFDVRALYGRSSLWSLSVALRVRSPGPFHRMGRYGVVADMNHDDHLPNPQSDAIRAAPSR